MDAVNELQSSIRSELKALAIREPKIAKKTKKIFDKADDDFYMDKLIDVYSGHLSNSEVAELIIFLKSDIGKKLKKYTSEPNNINFMRYFNPEERKEIESKGKSVGLSVFRRISDTLFIRKANDYLLKSIKELPGEKAPYYIYLGVKSVTGKNDDTKSARYFSIFSDHLNKIEQIYVTNSESYEIAETRTIGINFDKYHSNNIDYLVTVLILKDDGTEINIELRAIDILENRLTIGKRYRGETTDLPEIANRFSIDMKKYILLQ